jgi:Fur family peroxide stress response transcriptional regulator
MQKIDTTDEINLFRNKCKEQGLKVTPQRTIIYKELLKATDHPSIDIILKKVRRIFPNISFDTVYRTVLSLSKIGVINIVEGYGGSKRFDPNIAPHHHFKCTACHRIIDFYNENYDNIKIPADIQKRFNVVSKRVLLEGLCKKCSKKK